MSKTFDALITALGADTVHAGAAILERNRHNMRELSGGTLPLPRALMAMIKPATNAKGMLNPRRAQ